LALALMVVAGGELLEGLVGLGPVATGPLELPTPIPGGLVE
jgi:hypothetical protein